MNKDLPRHIQGAFKAIERFLPVADIIVELVDARMPQGSRLKGFVNRLHKTSVIALSKADLADETETKRWLKRFNDEGLFALELNCREYKSVKKLAEVIKNAALKPKKGQNMPARKVRRAMIIGVPNVGKSTLINALARRSAAKTADKPGVTRSIQWVKLNSELELLDLPGILDFNLLKRGDILELINTVPGAKTDVYAQAKTLIEVLKATENIHILPEAKLAMQSFELFINKYAQKMNFCTKGAEPDINRAAADVIKRFQKGLFGRVTLEKSDNNLFNPLFNENLSEPEAENESFN